MIEFVTPYVTNALNNHMNSKEISVFIIGMMLIGFLYLMKFPSEQQPIIEIVAGKTVGIDKFPDQEKSSFDPTTKFPILESILDVPAWQIDLATIEALTNEELVKSILTAIENKKYYQPENDNALFFLLNLKSIDPENSHIEELTQNLTAKIATIAETAIQQNNDKTLTTTISRLKTLAMSQNSIKYLEEKLASIKTINKLYKKGHNQVNNNLIVEEDSNDAWHTAKQCLEVDLNNPKTKLLVSQVIDILVSNALRAAEEIDFQLANRQIEQAGLLTPDSQLVFTTKDRIDELKRQRYLWLEQQMSIAIDQNNVNRAIKMMAQLEEIGIQQSQLLEYNNEIDRMTIFGKYTPLQVISSTTKDKQNLPTMVVMPIGKFNMGSNNGPKNEKPKHNVNINYGFAVSQNEISIVDFKLFIENSGYNTDAEKNKSSKIYDLRTGRLKNKNRITWKNNYIGKKAHDDEPVIHVSWNDAIAYTQWLSQQTGESYRLLTESEFEYILRAGSTSYYPWGDENPIQIIENLTGKQDKSKGNSRMNWKKGFEKYNDKYWGPAPVGSFIPNPFKLNDTAGNVMEWVMDCWHDSYARAPLDGSSWTNLGCDDHVIRGGSWSSAKNGFSSTHRFKARSNFTDARLGFRIAMDLK